MSLPEPLSRLVEHLQKLPGIGAKGAQRLAFHILRNPRDEAERLCDAIRDVKEQVTYCSTCNNITAVDPCMFCTGPTRDPRTICVVEEPQNVMVVEKTREFRGLYHVLMGVLIRDEVVRSEVSGGLGQRLREPPELLVAEP